MTPLDVTAILKSLINVYVEPSDFVDIGSSSSSYNMKLALQYHKSILNNYTGMNTTTPTTPNAHNNPHILPYKPQYTFYMLLDLALCDCWGVVYDVLQDYITSDYYRNHYIANNSVNKHTNNSSSGNNSNNSSSNSNSNHSNHSSGGFNGGNRCSFNNIMEKLIETSVFSPRGSSAITAKLYLFQLNTMLMENSSSGSSTNTPNTTPIHNKYTHNRHAQLCPSYKSFMFVCRSFDNDCDWDGILTFFNTVRMNGTQGMQLSDNGVNSSGSSSSSSSSSSRDIKSLSAHWETIMTSTQPVAAVVPAPVVEVERISHNTAESHHSNPSTPTHHSNVLHDQYNPAQIETLYTYMIDICAHIDDPTLVLGLVSDYLEYYYDTSNTQKIKTALINNNNNSVGGSSSSIGSGGGNNGSNNSNYNNNSNRVYKNSHSKHNTIPVFTNGKQVVEAAVKVMKKHDNVSGICYCVVYTNVVCV